MEFKDIQAGTTFGIVAPASEFKGLELSQLTAGFSQLGYQVKFAPGCSGNYMGYLAGSDEQRAKDVEMMFTDDEVDVVMCLRGGYGTPRMVDLLDLELIGKHAKPFIGYSDITALHLAFNQKVGMKTYHGIMASNVNEWDELSYRSLVSALNFKNDLVLEKPENEMIETIVEGCAEGLLVGGNLALIAATMGTPYEIDTKDKIVFIEEVGEPIYNIDRMLTQLALAHKFEDCAGIIFGDFADCTKRNELEPDLIDLLKERVSKFNKPCIYNVQSGHCKPMLTLPMHEHCVLDASNQVIKFIKK